MGRAIKRVVVRRVDNLGDIVIALPVLRAIRRNYPNAELTLMVRDVHQALCDHIADSFIPPTSSEEFSEIAHAYDVAFDIEYFGPGNHSKQVFRKDGVNYVNAVPGKRRRPMAHHLLDGLAMLGLTVPRFSEPRFKISSQLRLQVSAWIQDSGLSRNGNLWIGIHVGSRVKEKCWPQAKFIMLVRWLYRAIGAQLFFFGSSAEAAVIQTVRSCLPLDASRVIVGEPLDFVAGLLSRMDFVVGNDSGIGHLAAAVRTPTVSIFGPTMPSLWRPASEQSVVVHKDKRQQKNHTGPPLTVEQVRQGISLCIHQHVQREKFPVLDKLRLAKNIEVVRSAGKTIVRHGEHGPSCLVTSGWRRVKQILREIEKSGSYKRVLHSFPDAQPLIGLFILHGIIQQGNSR